MDGARQTGKSALVRQILTQRPDAVERRLDRPEVRSAATDDPSAFLHHDGLMVINEVQRVPELLRSIKDAVDVDPRPQGRRDRTVGRCPSCFSARGRDRPDPEPTGHPLPP